MNRKTYSTMFLFLALSGAMIYFREYIIAINGWFSNFILGCWDFGQYSYEAYTYFQQKFIFDSLVPDKEPGIFLVTTVFTYIIWVSSPVSLLFQTFLGQFILLFTIWFISRKMTGRNIYGVIGILIAITLFQLANVYFQLISRQLFSTTFVLLGSSVYLFPMFSKKIRGIFLTSIFLSMSFISHRFGWIIAIGGIVFWLFFHVIKFRKVNYSYLLTLLFITLMTLPFIYFLWKYSFVLSNSKRDIFLSQELVSKEKQLNLGFSYLASSANITITPILHYFLYQPFYIIFVIASWFYLFNYFNKKNLLFSNIFLCSLIYTFLKVTFSVRALVWFEIFLIPIIVFTFQINKSKHFKILILFLFILIWICWIGWRAPITFKKVIPKDSSILFIESNFNKNTSLFLSSNRCDSEIFTQLYYFTSENLGNDNLEWISDINQKDILSYNGMRDISTRNFNTLIAGRPYLHEAFSWKDVYLPFWRYTDKLVLGSLKNRSHPIFQLPYVSLVYDDYYAQNVKYIFKLDMSKISFFNNGYYLRDAKTFK